MNKYQKALDRLNRLTGEPIQVFESGEKILLGRREIVILQELVDKETPQEPHYAKVYPVASCPVCESNLGDNPRCRECGQAIDWTDTD